MRESTSPIVSLPAVGAQDVLTSILRDGAQRMLTHAIEAEVAERAVDSRVSRQFESLRVFQTPSECSAQSNARLAALRKTLQI